MISELSKKEIPIILYVINNAAKKYEGIVPDECLHNPYMTEGELLSEYDSGVRMFGYAKNNNILGVMGIQEIKDVILIRHAYTLNDHQRKGVGKSLLNFLLENNSNTSLLVGTWKKANWAINFYEKFDFELQNKRATVFLLNTYWKIPLKQIQNSVVLKKSVLL